jgi:PAS domain S-box-containing protein
MPDKKTILLVEDEALITIARKKILEKQGYAVITAQSGEEAVKLAAENEKIDLVLIDIDLGKRIDGPEAARQILPVRNVPIVFLTPHAEKAYVDRIKEVTHYGCVIKDSGEFVLQSSIEMAFELFNAKKKAQDVEKTYHSLFENMIDGFAYCQMLFEGDRPVDFVYLAVNEAFSIKTGLRDVVGKRVTEVIPGIRESDPGLFEILGRVARTGEPEQCEFYAESLRMWFMLSVYSPDRDHFVAIFDVITERKQAEEALRNSEAQLRAILDATPFPIALVDFQDNIIDYWSRSALTLFGHTAPTAQEWYQIAYPDPDYRREVIDKWKASLEIANESHQTGVNTGEYRVTCHDGSVRICELYVTFLTDRLVVTFNDITDRKRVEEALRENEAQLRSILRVAPVGIGTVVDRVINQTNDTLCAMTGYTHDELQGQSARLLYPTQDDFEFVGREKYAQIADYGTGAVETRWLRKDGTIIDVLLSSTPLDLNDLHKGVTFTALDITTRKRAEDALRHAHDELEKRVAERTAELNQAYEELQRGMNERERLESKLRQSHKMEAIGTLAGGIAHDFNNILAGIIGFSEMVLEATPPGNPSHRYVELILKSGIRGRDLVKQILAFSRKTDYEREPHSVSSMITESVKMLRHTLPSTIRIDLKMIAPSDMVLANPTEIQQIVVNLCTNAAYAMREKGGDLSIAIGDAEPKQSGLPRGRYVELVVKDTGEGMDPEVIDRIFEPFFTTKEEGHGTGMGLSVVYGIVKSLGGDIFVESKPGAGTTFRVFLPKLAASAAPEGIVDEAPRGRERILFIDDEEVVAEWGKAVLEKLGYTVSAMTDSRKALMSFSKNPMRFDLVFTDQTMPYMTGLVLAGEILKIRPEIPIILCTGHSDAVSPEIVKAAGIERFLLKPLGKLQFAEAVRRTLDAKKTR